MYVCQYRHRELDNQYLADTDLIRQELILLLRLENFFKGAAGIRGDLTR